MASLTRVQQLFRAGRRAVWLGQPYTSPMIPLIAHTPRLLILAASRALLTAELHKPHYFPVLLGAALPTDWPPGEYDREAMT